MKLILPPLPISETDGFKDDILNRKPFGEALLNLVTKSDDELVISIDGKWGEGKTTFIRKWQGLLSEANIPNIYFDAFSNDYVDDAFIAIASAITSYADSKIETTNKEKLAELKNKAVKLGGQLLSWTTKIGIKAITLGVVKEGDIDKLIEMKDDIANDVSDTISGFVKQKLQTHAKDVELIQSFKESLSELPQQLSTDNKPLIIIIDELDRCKPTFAVEIIEKIKHMFSVKKVVFVLVMHKQQLEEAVKCIYGQNIDAYTYLQKFINIETRLPKKLAEHNTNNYDIKIYADYLFNRHEFEPWVNKTELLQCVGYLANGSNLSLRQLEKVFTNIALFYSLISKEHFTVPFLITFLSVVKVVDPQLFVRLLHAKATLQDAYAFLKNIMIELNSNDHYQGWLIYTLAQDSELSEGIKIKYSQHIFNYDLGRKRIIPYLLNRISLFNL